MSDAGNRLTTYLMLGMSLPVYDEGDYAECTCGHFLDPDHEDGQCLVIGCGCGL